MFRDDINPKIRGWVNHFQCGKSGRDLNFAKSSNEVKVRRFATRQTPKKRAGRKSYELLKNLNFYVQVMCGIGD